MQMDDMILVSIDDHVIEPPGMFDGFLPAKYADRAPKVVTDDVGPKWVFGEGEARNVGLNAVSGRIPEEWGLEPTKYEEIRVGCFDVKERIKDMDANGVLGSLNFPSMARFCGQFFATRVQQDPDLALAVLQAYNNWHIEGWCAQAPGRFIPCTIPPYWDPQLMAAEIRRTAAKGSHCVSFSMNPHALGMPSLHSDHWDPFWAACQDTETVVTMHIGSGGLEVQTSPDAPMNVRLACSGINIYPTAADLVWAPMFRKFKGLKVALAEGGIGWIPYFLERLDFTYAHHKAWTLADVGDKQLPSEIFNDHVITCFISDTFGLKNLHEMNEDMVTWECDYPHSDSTWPHSPEAVWESITAAGLTDEQIDKVTHANAMRLFSYDPFSVLLREECTVGALRKKAEGHDVSLVSHGQPEHKIRTLGEFVAAAGR